MSRSPRLHLLIPVALAMTPLAQADYTFAFPTTAADSAAVNAELPCQSFDEKKGTTTTLTASAGAIKLTATWGAVPAWGAQAGILLGMNKRWSPVDFSGVTSVTFSYKTGDAKTAIEFAPNSPKYLGSSTDNGVMMLAPYAGSTSSKKVTVGLPDGIAFTDWMITQAPDETEVTWDDVKTEIKSLQFSPKPVYNASGSTITGAATATLEIKDVSIQGEVNLGGGDVEWIRANKAPCPRSSPFVLSDFGSATPNLNRQGSLWFSFTDTTSGTLGLANGASKLLVDSAAIQGISYYPGDTVNPAMAGITALLDKGDTHLHPNAGWAAMSTGFKDKTTGDVTYISMTGLVSLSFQLSMSDSFDVKNLEGVIVKIGNKSIPDSLAYRVGIPYGFNDQVICLEPSQFKQPVWYTSKNGGLKSLPLGDVGSVSWEIRIQNPDVAKASKSSFRIGKVTFNICCIDYFPVPPCCWTDSGTGLSNRKVARKPTLMANYANSLILSYALDGAGSATIEVVRMDGSKVASFDGAAKMTNATFPVNLARGTYLAVVRHGTSRMVAPFAVMR